MTIVLLEDNAPIDLVLGAEYQKAILQKRSVVMAHASFLENLHNSLCENGGAVNHRVVNDRWLNAFQAGNAGMQRFVKNDM